MFNKNKGFTLSEVLVTIFVIAVLTSLALPRWSVFVRRVRSQEGRQVLLLIYGAQQSYFKDNGAYATNMANLNIEFTSLKNVKSLTVLNATSTTTGNLGVAKPYIASVTENIATPTYTLYLLTDGTVVCSPDSVGSLCDKMGYPHY